MESKRTLRVSVEDSGIGISKEDLENLFRVFGKLKASAHMNKQGIGLGLTICKKITEFMGGGIDVISEENKGTRFDFHVNVSKVKEKEIKIYKI